MFFISAEAYKNMPDEERLAYISGWMDGRLNAGAFGTVKTISALRDCIQGKNITITQVVAIVDKYIRSHPEGWNKPATSEADTGLDESMCHFPY
jgi:hypothetical protein